MDGEAFGSVETGSSDGGDVTDTVGLEVSGSDEGSEVEILRVGGGEAGAMESFLVGC